MLGLIVFAIGNGAAGSNDRVRRWGAAIGGLVFLATVWIGVAREKELTTLALGCLAWAGLTVGTTWIAGALAAAPFGWLERRAEAARHRRERIADQERYAAQDRERRRDEHFHREEMARIEGELKRRQTPPPPANRQELLARARARHEATLAMLEGAGLDESELKSALLRAKQQFLRDVDEAIG